MRYWAGARRAAGRESEQCTAATVAELIAHLGQRPGMPDVIAACSVLIDGAAGVASSPLADGCVVDLLPPFAGG